MQQFEVAGFDAEGITLISPFSAEFDSSVDSLVPEGMADVVRDGRPYVVMISNKTSQRIVAWTLAFSTLDGTAVPDALTVSYPASTTGYYLFMAPDAVGSTGVDFGDRSDQGIAAGRQRILGLGVEIPVVRPRFSPQPNGWDDDRIWDWGTFQTREFFERLKRQGARTRGFRVQLDAVIFDDGLLIGSDASGMLREQFEQNVRARQDLYRQIVNRLDQGIAVGEAFPTPPNVSPEDDLFRRDLRPEAISNAQSLRKRYGDDKIRDVLEQAILKEPFVVRRK